MFSFYCNSKLPEKYVYCTHSQYWLAINSPGLMPLIIKTLSKILADNTQIQFLLLLQKKKKKKNWYVT